MVLADTSIWIDYFRSASEPFKALLMENRVTIHPLVIGELACGNLHDRQATLGLFDSLPKSKIATDQEAYYLIATARLYSAGIGYVGAHLLRACRLTRCQLWTKDKGLLGIAENLDLNYNPRHV